MFLLSPIFTRKWYCLFAQWFNVVQCGPFSLLLLPLYIAIYVLSLLWCFIIEMFDIPIWRCFDLSICSLNNHLDLQHFLYYLVKSLFSRSSLQVSCIKGSIIFNWANVWIWRFFLCLWLWLGGSHHSLPVITDQFQLQWKSSLPLSSENSGNSVLIAGTEILNGRHEWISCFHFTQSPPFHTHTM